MLCVFGVYQYDQVGRGTYQRSSCYVKLGLGGAQMIVRPVMPAYWSEPQIKVLKLRQGLFAS